MGFFLGIDGGGTKTTSILADENFRVILKVVAGRTNPIVIGADESAKVLAELIKTAATKKRVFIDAAVIGLAGCGRKENADAVQKKLTFLIKKNKLPVKKIFVTADIEIALAGAFPNDNGAILIAGTGSIIYGKEKSGKCFRAGGFGKIIGDEGSGYSIGLKGLKAVAEHIDERGNTTALTEVLKKRLGVKDRDTLISKVYSNKIEIASVAQSVIQAAANEDIVCMNILHVESNELIRLVKTLKKKMSVRKLKLCLLGGLLLHKNYYSKLVLNKIKKECAGVTVIQPANSPEIGAIILAKEKTNL